MLLTLALRSGTVAPWHGFAVWLRGVGVGPRLAVSSRMPSLRRLVACCPVLLALACGGSSDTETSSTSGTNAGGAGGAQAGAGGSAQAGAGTSGTSGKGGGAAGGSAGTAGKSGAGGAAGAAGTAGKSGAGGAAGAAGKSGAAGAAGAAGKSGGAGAAGAAGGAGGAGGSAAGAGGAGPGCCTQDLDCGDFAYVPCVNGVCKQPLPGTCWKDAQCGPDATCVGASVCPCNADCDAPDAPGTCKPKGDFSACNGPGDCVLLDAGCCGGCGVPKAKDKVAVATSLASKYHDLACAIPGGTDACVQCEAPPNPDLAAFCIPDSGEVDACGVVEISKDKVSACSVDDDCMMHLAACCDCGTGTPDQYVALAKSGMLTYEKNLCGPGGQGCTLGCVGQHPAGYAATCDPATKHCKVTKL